MNYNIDDIRFNSKRKQLLERIDRNEKVNNIDLGMYDLTTYYDIEDESNLIDKILDYENEGRVINHIRDKKMYFMPEQEEVINIINSRNRLIISAPTSFGKTLIMKEYIFRFKPSVIVYIVPTNALAYELERDFKNNELFSKEYEIFDKNMNDITIENHQKLLFIGTQEKFIEINMSFNNIDLFVIDEAYKLQDPITKQRGFKLSQAFLESMSEKCNKIVLLTPNAKFIGFDKFNFYEYQTHFNAVDRIFHKIDVEEFNDILYKCALNSKTILYCEAPNDMVSISNDAATLKEVNTSFVNYLEEEFHPDWSVVKLLKKGILTHHGMMPKYIQNRMIYLFNNDSNFNLLIGTNSISEGINTPTKNIFFDKDCNFSKEKLLYKNTIGRAGRLGKFPIGHIYSTKNIIEDIDNEEIVIELSVSNKETKEEVEDSLSDIKINSVFESNYINSADCIDKIKTMHLPLSRLKKILSVLSEDLKFPGLASIPQMAYKVFPEDYPVYLLEKDNIYIRGCMQYNYKINEFEKKHIRTFTDKIDFFKFYYSKKHDVTSISNSDIIEGYMKFMYSSLEYYIVPIMSVGKTIIEYHNDWKFGENVKKTIEEFFEKYYAFFYGVNLDNFSDNHKKIIQALKEYGISIKDININLEILEEIEKKLNVRYSTFDVIASIRKLSNSNSKFNNVYKYIIAKYVGDSI